MSSPFYVSNGVRQCGEFFPLLFYMDDLSVVLSHSQVGCNVNNIMNHVLYDSVLLTSSPVALHKLLDVCCEYAGVYVLKYNVKKTVCASGQNG